MRTVMIATPAYEGTVDVRYTDALLGTIRQAPQGVQVVPVFLPGDALVQRARNSLCKIALDALEGRGVDDVVFIDADVYWAPAGFWRLLGHDLDVVGGVVRQARDPQVLAFRPKVKCAPTEDGLLEVAAVGAAFLRVTRQALRMLWRSSREYADGPARVRSIFEVTVERGELCSEDVAVCHKWTQRGGKVWVDLKVACGHVGRKAFELEAPQAEALPVPGKN